MLLLNILWTQSPPINYEVTSIQYREKGFKYWNISNVLQNICQNICHTWLRTWTYHATKATQKHDNIETRNLNNNTQKWFEWPFTIRFKFQVIATTTITSDSTPIPTQCSWNSMVTHDARFHIEYRNIYLKEDKMNCQILCPQGTVHCFTWLFIYVNLNHSYLFWNKYFTIYGDQMKSNVIQ